jgi:hypothetical protein
MPLRNVYRITLTNNGVPYIRRLIFLIISFFACKDFKKGNVTRDYVRLKETHAVA